MRVSYHVRIPRLLPISIYLGCYIREAIDCIIIVSHTPYQVEPSKPRCHRSMMMLPSSFASQMKSATQGL